MGITFKIDEDLDFLKQMTKELKQLNNRHIRFGWINGKGYPSGHDNAGLSVAQVANWQEFGTIGGQGNGVGIPPRPYFRQTINMIRNKYYDKIALVYQASLYGRSSDPMLTRLSQEFVKDYHESVTKQNHKSLANYTIEIKGHRYQMDHTGVMLDNFEAKVFKQNIKNIKD